MSRWTKFLRRRNPRSGNVSRRAFLGGAGALLTLPVFESLVGEKEAYADDNFPARTLLYYVPNGIVMNNWTPASTGGVQLFITMPLGT